MINSPKSITVRLSLVALAAVLAGCSGDSAVRGSYINNDDGAGAFLVQIDDVRDHDVHGTISFVGTDAKGQIVSTRTPVSGTIDGKALNLTIENGTGSGMATGTVVPGGLQLTLLGNGRSLRLLFRREDAADFDTFVSDVRRRAAHARQDVATAAIEDEHIKELASIQRDVEGAADRLFADAETVSQKGRQIEDIVAGYPKFTTRADQLRAAAKRIDPVADANGRLEDINWRLNANLDTVTNAHSDAQAATKDIENSNAGDVSRANQLLGQCQTDSRLTCSRLIRALAVYTTSANNLRAIVARERSAFDAQRARF